VAVIATIFVSPGELRQESGGRGVSGGQHAWEQPIRRLADTGIGVVVGVAAAWLLRMLCRTRWYSRATRA
jgi:hypothetical protein